MKKLHLLSLLALTTVGCAIENADPTDDDGASTQTQQLPKCDPIEGCPTPPPRNPPPPPPPPKSYPDLLMELVLPALASCNAPGVASALQDEVGRSFPGATREFKCVNNTRAKLGLWLRTLSTTDQDHDARVRGLDATSVVNTSAGETVGFGVPRSVIQSQVEATWAAQPKTLDHNGNPASGPVHLSSHSLTFDGTNKKIQLQVDGYDTDPVPDVSFTYKSWATLSTQNGQFKCQPGSDFHADTTWQWILGGAFLGLTFVAPWITPIFTFTLANAFFLQGTIISSIDPPSPTNATFCDAAASVPQKVLLKGVPPYVPAKNKLVFDYTRASTDTGMVAAGTWSLAQRTPSLQVAGTRYIDVYVPRGYTGPATLSAVVTAKSDDLLTPTFTFTPDPGATMTAATTQATFQSKKVSWTVPSVTIGQEIRRNVSASAVDIEGMSASGSTFFGFRIKEEPSTDPKPVCKAKPWMCDPTL